MNIWIRSVVLVIAWAWLCTGHLIGEPPPVGNRFRDDLLPNGRDVRGPPLSLVEAEILNNDGSRDQTVPDDDDDVDRFELEEIEDEGISLSIGDEQYSLRFPPSEEFLEEFPFNEMFHLEPLMSHWTDVSQEHTEDITNDNEVSPWPFILGAMGKYYLPRRYNLHVSKECRKDLGIMYNPKNGSQTINLALMIDSWGKVPDGFMAGNFKSLGSFGECTKVLTPRNPPDESSFKGKYCTIKYSSNGRKPPPKTDFMREHLVRLAPPSALEPRLQSFVMYGTCIPSSCTEEDLQFSLNQTFSKRNVSSKVLCQTEDSPALEPDAAFIAMTVVLSILGFLLLTSSILDIYIYYSGKDEIRKGSLKYLLVFSVYTNLEKMFQVNLTENKEAITCIYGMRVLSMTWVCWGHQAALSLGTSGNVPLLLTVINGHWLNQILLNAMPSVDSFFFMSGLLVAYGVIKEKAKSGKINIIVFYLHRILRLAIPITLLGGFFAAYTKYMGYGPYANKIEEPGGLQYNCQQNWWRDAIFISNYGDLSGSPPCLAVTWYTSVEFQIFLFTPIMLFPFLWGDLLKLDKQKRNIIGLLWLGVLLLFSGLIPGIIILVNELPPGGFPGAGKSAGDYQNMVYMRPWCRAAPYMVGLILGTVFRLDGKQNFKLQKWQVAVGWLMAVTTGICVIFGMYDYNQFFQLQEYNWAISFFYGGFGRMAWGMALAWVIFACKYGYGGPVNTFLSHPIWQPISRLTYCTFLVAIPVQVILFNYNAQFPHYWSHLNKVVETVGAMFIAGIGAILLSLVAEAPVLGLEKHLLRRGK